MRQVIVTTTINHPTEAIRKYDQLPDWHLVVIGDQATPTPYSLKNGTYVTPEDQHKYDPELSNAIGWNNTERRNFGFLIAKDHGADIIATIDDDNIPHPTWGADLHIGKETEGYYISTEQPVYDPIYAAGQTKLWHRGFPLQLIGERNYFPTHGKYPQIPQIQADFWQKDPDIDAVCRIGHPDPYWFDKRNFPIMGNRPAPFNCQNTFLSKEVLPHYFLWPQLGRCADIWAAYYVQAQGHPVIFGAPSVTHKRNPHDPVQDIKAELIGYEYTWSMIQTIARHPELIGQFLPDKAKQAQHLYRRHWR